jgi:flagellar basal body-associated protein FliL
MKFVKNVKTNQTKTKSKDSAVIVIIVAVVMLGLAVSIMGASAVQVKAKEWLHGGGTDEAGGNVCRVDRVCDGRGCGEVKTCR